jgi:release factor glutamine methyltransferase
VADGGGVALGDLVADAAQVLAAGRIPEPRREALRVWADVAEMSPVDAILGRRHPVSAVQVTAFLNAVERRAVGEPLAYVSGRAGFRRLMLQVDRRVLIPRPETEGLVELVLARAPRGIVADICAGSGCIALSLADEGQYQGVLGVDLSRGALDLAAGNALRTGLPVLLLQGDLTAPLAAASLDVLVANPPYIAAAEYAALDASVLDWEPRLALESGSDGLDATRRLLDDGRRVVVPGGWMALEIDASRADATARAAGSLGWQRVMIHHDLFGRERYLLAQRSEIP